MLVFLDSEENTQHIKRQNPKQNLEHIPLFFQDNILVEMLTRHYNMINRHIV